MFNTLVIVIVSYFVYQISQLLHEMGHAIAYRLACRSKKWRIEIGRGKQILKTKRFKIHLVPADGAYYLNDDYEEWYYEKNFIMFLAGPLVNIILFICMIPFIYDINHSADVGSFYHNIVFITFYISFWKALISLLPKEYKSMKINQTDGLELLNIIEAMKKERESNTIKHTKNPLPSDKGLL